MADDVAHDIAADMSKWASGTPEHVEHGIFLIEIDEKLWKITVEEVQE
jgi:hypothetical protein